MEKIKLHIVIFTYNHEKYIEQCLNSILYQKVNFKYKITIFDDCSTDRTIEIISKYKDAYPDVINTRVNKKNVGVCKNFSNVIPFLKEEYIIAMDGDDYWLEYDNKLMKQISFLDKNRKYIMCGHNCILKDDNDNLLGYMVDIKKDEQVCDNPVKFITGEFPYMHASTTVFRNCIKFPKKLFSNKYFGDYLFKWFYMENGESMYFSDVLSVYRQQNNGVWSSLSDVDKVLSLESVRYNGNLIFNRKYDKFIHLLILNDIENLLMRNISKLEKIKILNFLKRKYSILKYLFLKIPNDERTSYLIKTNRIIGLCDNNKSFFRLFYNIICLLIQKIWILQNNPKLL